MFTYHMPTQCFVGRISANKGEFSGFGRKAYIVTDKSAEISGALGDVTAVLDELGVEYGVFDGVEENPSAQNVQDAGRAAAAFGGTFIIGIGGGSPMDAAKAVAILAANPGISGQALFDAAPLKALPVLLAPTTAGTGSETTPYAILTDHERRTKSSIPHRVFAEKAFLDSRYLESLPDSVALSSAVDALTHLVEGYTSASAQFISDSLAAGGIMAFGRCADDLISGRFTPELREELLLISAQAGMVIAQTKTTLPHQMGYPLTYNKNVPHGFACGMLTVEYLRLLRNRSAGKEKVWDILGWLGMEGLERLDAFLKRIMPKPPALTSGEISAYAQDVLSNKARLATCPFDVTLSEIISMYENSLY